MISSLIVATACMGQVVCGPPVIVQEIPRVVIAPPLYIDYCLGGMVERTRTYKDVPYRNGKVIRVPVINGYVPSITHTKYGDGSERLVYDYRIGQTYDEVMLKWKLKRDVERRKILPRPEPEVKPIPPKPELQSVLVKPEEKRPTLAPSELDLVPIRPEPKLPQPEPKLPQPEPKYLSPVVPSDDVPRVIIPPSYRDN